MNGQETKFLPSVFLQRVATPSLPVPLISCSIIRKKTANIPSIKVHKSMTYFSGVPTPHFRTAGLEFTGVAGRLNEDKVRGMTAFFLRLDINAQLF